MVSPSRRKKRRNLPWFFIILFSIFAIVVVLAFFMRPDFNISMSQESITIQKGAFGTLWIKVISKNGFNSEVTFEISGEPSGVITILDENKVTPPKDGSIPLIISIKVSKSASTETSTLTITGKSGSLSHSATFLLNIIEPPPGANIISHNSFQVSRDVFQYYYIFGEVQNNLQSNIKDVNIIATLYDGEDVVATGLANPHSMIDILLPDQKSPFEIEISLEQNRHVDRYSLNVSSYVETYEIPCRNFTLQGVGAKTDEDGFYRLTGIVNNTGTKVVYGAKVVATFYDENGKVIMADFRYITGNPEDPFEPGMALSFELSTIPQRITPANYTIQVQSKLE